MGHLRGNGRRSIRPLALHAVLQSWSILRLGCRGPRDHSAAPSRKRSAIASSRRTDAIDSASLTIDRQDRDRHDLRDYVGHSFRLAWCAVASLHLINRASGNLLFEIWSLELPWNLVLGIWNFDPLFAARATATVDARGVADDEARSRKATESICGKVTNARSVTLRQFSAA